MTVDVPNKKPSPSMASGDTTFSSPRRNLVHQAVKSTLKDEEAVQPSKWQNFKQPLPLILQIFSEMTDKNEDFWFKAIPFFERKEYSQGTVLFRRGVSLELLLNSMSVLKLNVCRTVQTSFIFWRREYSLLSTTSSRANFLRVL